MRVCVRDVCTIGAALGISTFVWLGPCYSDDLLGFVGGETIDKATDKINAMANKTLKDFLDDEDKRANKLLNSANNDGILLGIQAGNEMTMLTSTIRTEFANEMDQKLSSATKDLKDMLVHVQRWEDSTDKIAAKAADLEDLFAIDIQNLPFDSVRLGVRRIHGGIFVENHPNSYKIDITGPDFGAEKSDASTTFNVTLNGKTLGDPQRIPPDHAIFNVSKDDLRGLFNKEKIVTLPLIINVKRKEAGPWFDIFNWFRITKEVTQPPYDVSLVPDYVGDLTVETQYPEYEWQSIRPAETKVVSVHTDTPIAISVPNPNLTGIPAPNNMKIDRGLTIACKSNMQPARMFRNGKVWLADELKDGFVSKDWVGGGGDKDASLNAINGEFDYYFGFKIGGLWNRCAESEHCKLSRDELWANSVDTTKDTTGCPGIKVAEVNWANNDSDVTIWVRRSGTLEKLRKPPETANAPWEIVYQPRTYSPKPKLANAPTARFEVHASVPVQFDVVKEVGDTTTTLKFIPKCGTPETMVVPRDISGRFKHVQTDQLLDRTRYIYEFNYMTTFD